MYRDRGDSWTDSLVAEMKKENAILLVLFGLVAPFVIIPFVMGPFVMGQLASSDLQPNPSEVPLKGFGDSSGDVIITLPDYKDWPLEGRWLLAVDPTDSPDVWACSLERRR